MTDDVNADADDQRLRERLRGADPAASLAPADPDRVARLLEATVTSSTDPRPSEHRGRGPATWLAAAAAALVLGGAVAVAALAGGEDHGGESQVPSAGGPSTGSGPATRVAVLGAPAATAGRCMVPDAEVLRAQSLAVRGTAQRVDDEAVTLAVEETYAGEQVDEVRVEAPAEQLALLVGAVDFEEGEEYLVAATDGRVTVCGFSGPATARLRSLYDEAFAG